MNVISELETFIGRLHTADKAKVVPTFLRCFDNDAQNIDMEVAAANWPSRQVGEVVAATPEAGNGHYAHLQTIGMSGGQIGGSAGYRLVAPDWALEAHVTEPAAGGEPDVIIENFTGITDGTLRFAEGAARRA